MEPTTMTLGEALKLEALTLPSGREIPMPRGMTVREEDILANKKDIRDGTAIDKVLAACTELTLPELAESLQGDRMTMLLAVRHETYGDDYSFDADCPRCGKLFEWSVDICDLKLKPLSDEGEGPFTITLPKSGHVLTFKLLRGKDESKIQRIKEDFKESVSSALMLLRTVGVKGIDHLNRDWFTSLPSADSTHFRHEYDQRDCGVDTSTLVECPSCEKEFEIDVPIGPDFFMPRSRSRRH